MQKSKKRTLFFIRAYNDLDHFTPVISEFVKKNENPIIINYCGLMISNDYRVRYLKSIGAIDIREIPDQKFISKSNASTFFGKFGRRVYNYTRQRNNWIARIRRRFFFNFSNELKFLQENNVIACVFEWGTPYIRGDLIERFFLAAKSIGLKTVAIPHGANVFVNSDVTVAYKKQFSIGKFPDNSDRNLYDYYVLQNPIRRDGWVRWGYDPIKTQAWGSPRFYPKWAKKNVTLCPAYSPSFNCDGKLKVAFMQFQKNYNINKKEIKKSLQALSRNPDICLVVKDSTRAGKEYFNKNKLSGELGDSLMGWVGNEVHSPSLIKWADCVVVFGSSIGIEVLIQNKFLINPIFFHSNSTLYEYFGASHDVFTIDGFNSVFEQIIKGDLSNDKNAINMLLSEIVYAGANKFDVPKYYYDKISSRQLDYGK